MQFLSTKHSNLLKIKDILFLKKKITVDFFLNSPKHFYEFKNERKKI